MVSVTGEIFEVEEEPGRWKRFLEFSRRNPMVVGGALLLSIMLLMAVFLTSVVVLDNTSHT